MSILKNRVGVACATVGAGTLTLGSAIASATLINNASWQDFATGGVTNGQSVRYLILDANGAWEFGPGTYTSAGTTLSRPATSMNGSVAGQQSSTGSLLVLSGSSQVFITAIAEDLGFSTPNNNYFISGAGNYTNSGGQENFGAGLTALLSLLSGSLNTAVGNSALHGLDTGSNNMAFGYQAAFALTGGFGNSAIGTQALLAMTAANYNTAIGYSAGALVTGSNNTIIGSASVGTPGPTSGSNNIMIGSGVDLPSATTDNQIVIGNIIYGTGASGTGVTIAGSIGIGTPSPDRRFHTEQESAATNSVTYVERITSTSTGTPANGIGVAKEYEVEVQAGVNKVGATLEVYAYDVTAASEDFSMVFKTMSGGAAATEEMRAGFAPIQQIQQDSIVMRANYGIVVPEYYELASGVSLDLGAGAIMEITG